MKAKPLKRGKSLSQPRARQAIEEICFSVGRSSIGMVLVASSKKSVVAILIGNDPGQLLLDLEQHFSKARLIDGDRESESRLTHVVKFIDKPGRGLDLPLDIRGTPFQRRVWQAVRKIPVGETATYKDIARKIGAPRAMRAVGNACSKCKISLAIPCHRVLRSDSPVRSGDRSGTGRRHVLLNREAKATS